MNSIDSPYSFDVHPFLVAATESLEAAIADIATLVSVESPSRDAQSVAASARAVAALIQRETGLNPELVDSPVGPHVVVDLVGPASEVIGESYWQGILDAAVRSGGAVRYCGVKAGEDLIEGGVDRAIPDRLNSPHREGIVSGSHRRVPRRTSRPVGETVISCRVVAGPEVQVSSRAQISEMSLPEKL